MALHAIDQCRPIKRSRWTQAVDLYWRVFVSQADREQYIVRGRAGWYTVGCERFSGKHLLRQHFSGKAIFGLRANSARFYCWFVAIDLDCHNRDPGIWRAQLAGLVENLCADNTWHLSFPETEIQRGGIHLIRVFDSAQIREHAIQDLRDQLRALDTLHPSLALAAKKAGMRSIKEAEIYPDASRGFRLLGAAGRVVITDHVLGRVGKRERFDLVSWAEWIADPNRQTCPPEKLLQYSDLDLPRVAAPECQLAPLQTTEPPSEPKPTPILKTGRARNTWFSSDCKSAYAPGL